MSSKRQRAALVVEPLRRQVLRGGREAVAHVTAQGRGEVVLGEEHIDGAAIVDAGGGHAGSSVGRERGDVELGAGGAHDGAVGHARPAVVLVERLGGHQHAAGGEACRPAA